MIVISEKHKKYRTARVLVDTIQRGSEYILKYQELTNGKWDTYQSQIINAKTIKNAAKKARKILRRNHYHKDFFT